MKQKVLRCFEAGAVATGCTWEWRPTEHPYAPLLHDDTLADLWDRNFEARGRVLDYGEQLGGGSTDMGNVSLVVPSIHPLLTFRGKQAPAHNPAFTEIAGSAEADDAILDGAATMAATVLDVALTRSCAPTTRPARPPAPPGPPRRSSPPDPYRLGPSAHPPEKRSSRPHHPNPAPRPLRASSTSASATGACGS